MRGNLQSFLQSPFLGPQEASARPPQLHQANKGLERAFGDFPIKALDDPRARSVFLEWRDQLAQTSRRQADYAYQVSAHPLGHIISD